jgi:hypothetical protein
MSKSISELIKDIQSTSLKGNSRPVETELKNPDIPGDKSGPLGGLDDEFETYDMYHSAMRLPSEPRSGMYALSVPLAYKEDRRDIEFGLEGSIDPNIIRAQTDPDSALPHLSSLGKFSYMPASTRAPHNQDSLIKKSRGTELRYRNRFQPSPSQPVPQQG